MRRVLALLAVAAALAAVVAHDAAARGSRAAVATGVVVVDTNLAYENAAAAGTGMVLTPNGEILTNNHVIRGATRIRVFVPQTKKTYAARVLGYDVGADVALLQLKHASGLSTVTVGNSSKLANGQAVTAIGNAGGTGSLTITSGSITGLHRNIVVSDDQGGEVRLRGLVETDASLQPGDSGGPLLDASRRVVGMDSAASSGFSFRQGSRRAGYAIPIDTAVRIARQIEASRSSSAVHVGGTGFLGVAIDPSDGVLVTGVVPRSPVANAGITSGDVITALGGHSVASQTGLVALILPHHPGDKVTLRWIDPEGVSHTGSVTLASGPPQ